jgi:malate dehydrogenase (oxaloacetate-decarboxylating)
MSDRKPVSPRTPAILEDPARNRGVAFSVREREELGLAGRLPSAVLTLGGQAERAWAQLRSLPNDLARSLYLGQLHDRNETLFFKVLSDHLNELLPIVGDPTAGEPIEQYSHEHRRPRGIYLSIDRPDDIEKSFASLGLGANDVDIIVCSDAGDVPGIGDCGVRRHPDCRWKAGHLHRRRWHPPRPGHPGVARCRNRQSGTARRPALPGQPA